MTEQNPKPHLDLHHKDATQLDLHSKTAMQIHSKITYLALAYNANHKSRLTKATGAESSGQMKNEKLHAIVARSTFGSEHIQNTRFGAPLAVEMSKKVRAIVVRSTFGSKKCQNTSVAEHFWKLIGTSQKCMPLAKHILK